MIKKRLREMNEMMMMMRIMMKKRKVMMTLREMPLER